MIKSLASLGRLGHQTLGHEGSLRFVVESPTGSRLSPVIGYRLIQASLPTRHPFYVFSHQEQILH